MRLKRVISAALAVSMAVSMMPATAVSAFATDVGNSVAVQTAENELTYNCGATENDKVTVSLVKNSDNDTYTLVVSGTGSMADYSKAADVPWYGDNGQLMKKVTKGIVKSGITHLGARTFVLAENLTSVELPEGLLSIGVSCFNMNGLPSMLTSIVFPSTLQVIDDYAFYHGKLGGDVEIPESVTKIGKLAFDQCPITSINLPKDLQTLGSGALKETKITEIPDIPAAITNLETTFMNCYGLTEVAIPSTVTSLGVHTFQNCSNLKSITLHGGITTIASDALKDCAALTDIKFNGTQEQWTALASGNTQLSAMTPRYPHNVTFNLNYQNNAASEQQVVYDGDKVQKHTDPERIGYTFDGWYTDAALTHPFDIENVTISGDIVLYAKWELTPVAATMTATTSKSAYLVNTPVDVNITVNPGTYGAEIHKGKVALTYGDEVEKVELNGKELTKKEYIVRELAQKLTSQSSNSQSSDIKATLNVTYKKAGKFDFDVALKDAKGAQICADGTQVVVAEEAAELTPATKLYTLTVKNADVTIKNGDEEIKAEKNDKGELIAKVPEKADVTVTYTSQSDAVAFDQWTITTDETLDVDVKNNPLKFQMPAGGVTIEAMTKDASIEEDEPNILGTAAVVGTAAAGTAILAWQGYQLGTELYLKTALPAGTAIPTNRAELALLVWNHAGKPAPAAVLPADATDPQKAIAWAVENDLLKAAKDNGETYVDTDSVSRVEVIRVWNKAQEK